MRKDKEKAIELRYQGQSYNEISRTIGIPKSTLSGWFKNVQWSEEIKEMLLMKQKRLVTKNLGLMIKANKERWRRWHEECRKEAVKEFPKLKNNPLFISGLMLYWGEGDKILKNGKLGISNSDPEMIKVFGTFLQKIMHVPKNKIAIRLLLYPDLADSPQKIFWSKLTGFPLENFRKSVYIKGRHSTRRMSYGVCNIEIYSRKLKEKILKWIELCRQYLLNELH